MEYEEFLKKTKGMVYNGVLSASWITGGRSGGNCWGDGELYSVAAEPEPDFYRLEEILEKVCPNISFLKYRKLNNIINGCSKRKDNYYSGYYGNWEEGCTKTLKIEDLYDALVEIGEL